MMWLFKKSFVRVLVVYTGLLPNVSVAQHETDRRAFRTAVELVAALPDYAYAGYDYGETPIPRLAGPVFAVTDFGAVPDDGELDRAAIQSAIDAAADAGGGVVQFPAGRFDLFEGEETEQVLRVRSSGIVLRGQGAGEGGTELYLHQPTYAVPPVKSWDNPPALLIAPDEPMPSSSDILDPQGQPHTRVQADAPTGSYALRVKTAGGFAVGDVVTVAIESATINERMLEGLGIRPLWERIRDTGVVVNELHRITAIDGDTITFHAPLMVDVRASEGWSVIRREVLERVGVEDIHFRGNFTEPFVHHKNHVHDSGFLGVTMNHTFRGWIRRCRFSDLTAGAWLSACLASSILDCEYDGNPGHSSFGTKFGTNTLIGRCSDRAGAWHGPTVSHLATGSVIWRYRGYGQRGGTDFHGTFPRHSLVDATSSSEFLSWGANTKNLPNHLGGLTFWNVRAETFGQMGPTLDFWQLLEDQPDKPYGPLTAVKPNIVSLQGHGTIPIQGPLGLVVPAEQIELPESLYEYQLELRLGSRPSWLDLGPDRSGRGDRSR